MRTATALLATLLALTSSIVHARSQYDDTTMLCLVNEQRAQNGLDPLGLDPDLTQAARQHSQDQADSGEMSHDGSDGSDPGERCERAGFDWTSVAENVAFGYDSMEDVMDAWMKSPGHRANILGEDYTMFGSGVAYDGNTGYFTQDFGNDGRGARNVPNCGGRGGGGRSGGGGSYNGGGGRGGGNGRRGGGRRGGGRHHGHHGGGGGRGGN